MAEDGGSERTQVSMQAELMARVRWTIKTFPELGFTTPSEFVRHWIRVGLDQAQRDIEWMRRQKEEGGMSRVRELRD